MEKRETICFTGHRAKKLCGYDISSYTDFVNNLMTELEVYITKYNIKNFITGGAQGFDQLVFWAVHHLQHKHPEYKIQNIVFVPFIGQENKWSDTGLFSKTDYKNMLSVADKIVICNRAVTNKSNFDTIRTALMDRNKMMVDESSRVIALCSETEAHTNNITGGTGNCARYALSEYKHLDKCVYKIKNNKLLLTDIIYN